MKYLLIILTIIVISNCKKGADNTPFSLNQSNNITVPDQHNESSHDETDVSIYPEVAASIYQHENKKYGYRLGDMFKSKIFRADKNIGEGYHLTHFPNSIAADYMELTELSNQYDILMAICDNRSLPYPYPTSDTLIIHLRIGDIIDNTPQKVFAFLNRSVNYVNGYLYVKPINFYQEIVNKLQGENYPISSITLIGGFHTPSESYKKSLQYVSAIKRFFIANGYEVTTRIDYPADDDFLYMINASYFTPSGGGFSMVIKKIVEIKGGQIIMPDY